MSTASLFAKRGNPITTAIPTSSEQSQVSLPSEEPRRSTTPLPALLILALGVALRLFRYLHDHSMWLDESMLSLNLVDQPWRHILEPLNFNQAAPIGFLAIEKSALSLLGASERALRLPALLFGLAGLPMAWLLFRRTLGPRGFLFALALFALAEEPLNYVSQVKQYSCDLFVTTTLLWLAVRFLQTRRGLLPLALVGAAGLWFSHASVFITAAIGLVLAWHALQDFLRPATPSADASPRIKLPLLPLTLLGLLWLASFAAEYVLSLHGISQSSYLKGYWADAFPPLSLSASSLDWYFQTIIRIPYDTLQFPNIPAWLVIPFKVVAALTISLVIDGFLLLRQRPDPAQKTLAAILATAFLCLFAAAALHEYPLQGRLLLFAMPLWILLAGFSIENFLTARKPSLVLLGRALALLILAAPLLAAGFTLAHPPADPDNRDTAHYLHDHARPGDVFLALGPSGFPTRFYLNTREPLLAQKCLVLQLGGDPWLPEWHDYDPAAEYLRANHTGRVWVLFSELSPDHPYLLHQRDMAVATFSKVSPLLDHHTTAQTEIDLFDIPAR